MSPSRCPAVCPTGTTCGTARGTVRGTCCTRARARARARTHSYISPFCTSGLRPCVTTDRADEPIRKALMNKEEA